MAAQVGPGAYLALRRREVTPADILRMHIGVRWQQSRMMEALANLAIWTMSPHMQELPDFDRVTRSFKGYDLAYQKAIGIDKPVQMPWEKKSV